MGVTSFSVLRKFWSKLADPPKSPETNFAGRLLVSLSDRSQWRLTTSGSTWLLIHASENWALRIDYQTGYPHPCLVQVTSYGKCGGEYGGEYVLPCTAEQGLAFHRILCQRIEERIAESVPGVGGK